ncbi:putative baseplate assembly protein [Paenibacillus sp. NEAU-GSW1]|uniref:putative baseplate assembly protein n=1 Tax=Paenibacillus sp. NEAU-GSW1 TaxID=2682486 RepID=UPI0012E1496E|nr:putative baseplate assembly protein [Paenibacillus sp. NEAU-GSW1]MUT65921.1 putative baseplate assembly protein [Paenibacillus sp. NEAU-GSW1]
MLPKLPLDDRSYADIVDQARRMIPKRVPEWTDENAHDPGITFLELFAWLTEMQRFFISRVPDRSRIKFLDLLGVKPADASAAKAQLCFSGISRKTVLPRGTKLLAEDQMFETAATLALNPLKLDRIVSRTELESNDVTASNEQMNISFYPFGKEAGAGSRLYISFDRELDMSEQIELSVKLKDGGLFGEHSDSSLNRNAVTPSATLSWKAYAWDEQSGVAGWIPMDVVEDETVHFTLTGKLTVRNVARMLPITVHPANDRFRYWICCTIEQAGYELPPRIDALMLHTVEAVQKDTLCESHICEFRAWQHELRISSYLALYGDLKIQLMDKDGSWRYLPESDNGFENSVVISRNSEEGAAVIRFSESFAKTQSGVASAVRFIASSTDFDRYRIIGRSNGLPGQMFELYDLPCAHKDAIQLQVGYPDANGTLAWQDWTRVDNFDHSQSGDLHFLYEPSERKVIFGNGEHGAVPPASLEPNIWLVGCELGGGEGGNVKPGLISEWINEEQRSYGLKVTNPEYARGGKQAESLAQTLQRAQFELKQTFRAVTEEDYETIIKSAPGVQVARVHAIPLFKPGLADYPRTKAPGQISVVVVPNSLSRTPQPSPGFLQTVKRHLDSRRLVTTEIHVIPPVYVKVTVHAVIVVEPQYIDEGASIVAALQELLRPLGNGENGANEGWDFGRPVYKGDIYNALSGRNGIVYIQDLWLDADGPHVKKSKGGDLLLPPHGLVYSGQHEIELVSRLHL